MRRNFVLLEICLIAVVVIALAAFVVPALTRLRVVATQTGCMANLDAGMKGFASYAADYDGWIFSHLPDAENSASGRSWGEVLYREKRVPLDALNCPTQPVEPGNFINTYGMLRTTLEPGNHFYKARVRRWGNFARNERGALYYQTREMKNPDQVMMLADTEIYEGKNRGLGFFAYHPVVPAAGSAVSLRHERTANQGFADGHAAASDAKTLTAAGFCRWVDGGKSVSR